MLLQPPPYDPRPLDAFIALAGRRAWAARVAEISARASAGPRAGQAIRMRHALELAIERLRGALSSAPSEAELRAARLAGQTIALSRRLTVQGRRRLRGTLRSALVGEATLVPL